MIFMITSYRFGHIEVDGRQYTSDVIILPTGINADWWRRSGHELCLSDIKPVLDEMPEVLVVGTGDSGMMKVLPEVEKTLEEKGIELIAHRTKDACRVFNEIAPFRKTAAALHLTC